LVGFISGVYSTVYIASPLVLLFRKARAWFKLGGSPEEYAKFT
jgi:preprotein translocase subunit SecF